MTDPKHAVRLKGQTIELKLGNEKKSFPVVNGYSDEVGHLARTLNNRIAEVQMKQHRDWAEFYHVLQQAQREEREYFDWLLAEIDELIKLCEE
jgi:hypothetical protein